MYRLSLIFALVFCSTVYSQISDQVANSLRPGGELPPEYSPANPQESPGVSVYYLNNHPIPPGEPPPYYNGNQNECVGCAGHCWGWCGCWCYHRKILDDLGSICSSCLGVGRRVLSYVPAYSIPSSVFAAVVELGLGIGTAYEITETNGALRNLQDGTAKIANQTCLVDQYGKNETNPCAEFALEVANFDSLNSQELNGAVMATTMLCDVVLSYILRMNNQNSAENRHNSIAPMKVAAMLPTSASIINAVVNFLYYRRSQELLEKTPQAMANDLQSNKEKFLKAAQSTVWLSTTAVLVYLVRMCWLYYSHYHSPGRVLLG